MSFAQPFPPITWAPTPWGLPRVETGLGTRTPFLPQAKSPLSPPPSKPVNWKALSSVAGLIGLGLLLKALPKRGLKTPAILSADWKDYAKIVLGALAASQLNKGLNVKLPPWLLGLETSAMIHPLVVNVGDSFLGRFVPLGLLVPALVEGGNRLNQLVEEKAGKSWGIPDWVGHLGVSLLMAGVGMATYPVVFKLLGSTGLLGKVLKKEASEAGWTMAGTLAAMCSRGCCQGSMICLTELGEIFGGLANWWKGHDHATATHSHQEEAG